jgi:replication fork protection complex subunit TIMELESS/Tof1/Swi1
MEGSTDEDDQEIAENIQNRMFYEETTHDRILTVLRNYKDQGRGYLDAVTELSHVFIRMLENYAKQNAEMQIRSARRTRKKLIKAKAPIDTQNPGEENDDEDQYDLDASTIRTVSSERKFDFHRFAARFSTQGCVDTYVAFIRLYKDLNADQLKRAHRFFYRVAFKMELPTILFRVDIIQLFHNMIKGVTSLDRECPSYKDWEELIRQIFKKLVKRIQDRPALMVEMLFSKMSSTMFYLENGYEPEKMKKTPRPPAELDIRAEIAAADRVSLVTEILVSESKFDALTWIKGEIKRAKEEREAWETADEARKVNTVAESMEGVHQVQSDSNDPPKAPTIRKYMVSNAMDTLLTCYSA